MASPLAVAASGAGPPLAAAASNRGWPVDDDGAPQGEAADRAALALAPGGEAAARGEPPHSSRGRRTRHAHCRVLDCYQPLGFFPQHAAADEQKGKNAAAYSVRHGVCMAHLRQDVLELDGLQQRFCQVRAPRVPVPAPRTQRGPRPAPRVCLS